MPTTRTAEVAIPVELTLDPGERAVLSILRAALLRRAVPDTGRRRDVRAEAIRQACDAALVELEGAAADGRVWAHELRCELLDTDREMLASVVDGVVDGTWPQVMTRPRALLVLVDLTLFEIDGLPWGARARRAALYDLVADVPDLRSDDVDRILREVAAIRRDLARRSVRWGRVAVVSAVGAGLGVVTMGAATPIIAGAVAGAGLSGAAATSAGLAALGGGSLAAGGFGVAGGTALLNTVGLALGAGLGATGSRVTGWGAGDVAREALRAGVATRIVVLEEEHDDELARRVVISLQQRLDAVGALLETLAERLKEREEQNSELRADNERLHAEAERLRAALQAAVDRIERSS